MWEARTNSIRNSVAAGGTAGTIGSGGAVPTNWFVNPAGTRNLAVDLDFGTEYGMPYIDWRVYGTPSATSFHEIRPEVTAAVAAAPSSTWTTSMFGRIVGGSLANISALNMRLLEWAAGPTFVGQTMESWAATNNLTRKSVTRTMGATAAFAEQRIQINYTSGQPIDITLRFYLPQLELGASASPPIATTGSAGTRAVDIATITDLSKIGYTREHSFRVEARAPQVAGTHTLYEIYADADNYERVLRNSSGEIRVQVVASGSTIADLNAGVVAVNTDFTLDIDIRDDAMSVSLNGGTPVTDNTGTIPTLTTMKIGRNQSDANYWNSTVKVLIKP